VVEDLELGTNDCRGWISQPLFLKLGLPEGRFYQFRLAMADIQAKGCFKVMNDEVAVAAGADIIIPKSSTKPKVELSTVDSLLTRFRLWHPSIHARVFEGPLVLGIRDYSKSGMEYKSSYTLLQHTTEESLEKRLFLLCAGTSNRPFKARCKATIRCCCGPSARAMLRGARLTMSNPSSPRLRLRSPRLS
jgi:hypothetical protein